MIFVVFLISVSMSIALVFLLAFYLSLKNGQYDDTHTPSIRMLFDNKPVKKEKSDSQISHLK
ncbi:MAG TPA: cbb3-type cytochrome oxidase assembly protein CcoS [Cyclobacteriaceae bacterium]|nr:cbb3-type cytochrome oxidase assembly protein CcoS [Cyclobacteriaceae bacterium]